MKFPSLRAAWPSARRTAPAQARGPALRYPAQPLTDGHVLLRAWEHGDAVDRSLALTDPESSRWTDLPLVYPLEEAADDIARAHRNVELGRRVSFAIVHEGRVSGGIDLMVEGDGRGELGYVIAPWARRQHVATRAVQLISTWACRDLGFERLELPIPVGNDASQGVARRAGYREEGTLHAFLRLREDGPRHDVVMWSWVPGHGAPR